MNFTGVLFIYKTRRKGYSLMSEKFMKVDEAAEVLDCSKAHAYVIMRKLKSLQRDGYRGDIFRVSSMVERGNKTACKPK